ncbi:MAG TPA: O-antigen ligase family protein [Candidatus Hydrogenedentes bacterium]|nr:O-antigen ligase family protein [Candidatus Hydrogenedentota bacterium]
MRGETKMSGASTLQEAGAAIMGGEESARKTGTSRLFPPVLLGTLVAVYALYDHISYYFPPSQAAAFAYSLCALIVFLAILNVRWGLYAFLVCLVFADEISRNLWEYTGDSGVTSILTVSLGGVAVANLAALAIIAVALVAAALRFAERPHPPALHLSDWAIVAIAGLFAFATAHGIRNALANPRLAANHLNLPIMLAGMYFVVRFFFREEDNLFQLWRVLILATSAKIIGWTGLALMGKGSMFGTTLRVGFGAVWTLFVFVLLIGVVLVTHGRGVTAITDRVIAAALILMAGALLLISAGRMLWLLTAFGFLMLVILDRLRTKVIVLAFSALCATAIVYVVALWGESMFETIGSMAGTLKIWEAHSVTASLSTMARVYEFRNIHSQLLEHNNLLLGDGPGSTFSDQYHPYPFGLSENDYSVAEQESRQFRNSHSLVTQLILQVGYLGLLVYVLCFALIYAALYAAYRHMRHPRLRLIALSLLCFLPSMVYMSWNSKSNMLLGIVVGGTGLLIQNAHANSPNTGSEERPHAQT